MSHHKKKKTSSFVKQGRPIVRIPYRYLRFIATLTVIYHLCTLGFNLELINIAHHLHVHIGVYLNVIFESGDALVSVLCMSSIVGMALNIFIAVIVVKMFSGAEKVYYWLLFASMLLDIVLMTSILLLIFYMFGYAFSMNPEGIEYFYTAMSNYSTDGLTKRKLDIMQIELQCCGARNYSDWYNVDWQDTNLIKPNRLNIKLVGEVPFSCCSIRIVSPCIHGGVEGGDNSYKYEAGKNFSLNIDGCWAVIENRKSKSGLMVAGYLFCQFLLIAVGFVPLRLLQTASNEKQGFSLENYIYTGWLWGFYKSGNPEKTSNFSIKE